MKEFLSPEGGLYRFLLRFVDLLILNFWFLLGVPIIPSYILLLLGAPVFPGVIYILLLIISVISFGPMLVALYSVSIKMVDDQESYVTKQFFIAVKDNYKQAIVLGILFLAAIYIVYLNFSIFNQLEDGPIVLLIVGFFSGFYFLLSFLYAFALLARYQNKILVIIGNSFRISLKYFGRTLLMLLVIGIVVAMFLYNSTTLLFAILLGPSFLVFTLSWLSLRVFQKIEKEPD